MVKNLRKYTEAQLKKKRMDARIKLRYKRAFLKNDSRDPLITVPSHILNDLKYTHYYNKRLEFIVMVMKEFRILTIEERRAILYSFLPEFRAPRPAEKTWQILIPFRDWRQFELATWGRPPMWIGEENRWLGFPPNHTLALLLTKRLKEILIENYKKSQNLTTP